MGVRRRQLADSPVRRRMADVLVHHDYCETCDALTLVCSAIAIHRLITEIAEPLITS